MKNIKQKLQANKHLMPLDFNYVDYLKYNPDLIEQGINSENLCIQHYLLFGIAENRLYKQSTLIDGSIDIDFDAEFYLSEYPDVASYYKYIPNIPEHEKLYHHYLNFGKKEGRFKNKYEQDHSFVDPDCNISDLIEPTELLCPKNHLECVCLLTTTKELHNDKYKNFIRHLIAQTQNNKISKQIDFKIILNQKNQDRLFLASLQKVFADIEVVHLHLPPHDDLYVSELKNNQKLPAYGLKSGPNIMFFKTLEKTKKYNTTLLLETDCILGNNWLDNIYNYVNYANGFLVSGAIYDGLVFTKTGSAMMNHINGGTALYATNHPVLPKLLQVVSFFLQKQIAYNMPGLAYDYAMKLLIDRGLDRSYENKKDREIWQFINRNYLPSKLIINCSTDLDAGLDMDYLIKKYNYSILHKKQ